MDNLKQHDVHATIESIFQILNRPHQQQQFQKRKKLKPTYKIDMEPQNLATTKYLATEKRVTSHRSKMTWVA